MCAVNQKKSLAGNKKSNILPKLLASEEKSHLNKRTSLLSVCGTSGNAVSRHAAVFPFSVPLWASIFLLGGLVYTFHLLVQSSTVEYKTWRYRLFDHVSRCGLAVRRFAGKQDLGSIRFGSPFSSKIMVCGHCLVTLPTQLKKH